MAAQLIDVGSHMILEFMFCFLSCDQKQKWPTGWKPVGPDSFLAERETMLEHEFEFRQP
jgi:hypothetical protein